MQKYADNYLLQSYSTCFGCQSTHHLEYLKLYPQPPVEVILFVPEAAGFYSHQTKFICSTT